jgi:hypothetical protein
MVMGNFVYSILIIFVYTILIISDKVCDVSVRAVVEKVRKLVSLLMLTHVLDYRSN